jgi:hypothetical protein
LVFPPVPLLLLLFSPLSFHLLLFLRPISGAHNGVKVVVPFLQRNDFTTDVIFMCCACPINKVLFCFLVFFFFKFHCLL